MKPFTKITLITLVFLFTNTLFSQNERFNVGIIGGLNFSALEGEDLTDYFGLNTGILGTIKLSKRHQVGVEILFSQNGEYSLPKFYPKVDYGQIRLNHLEIPVHFDWLITYYKKNKIQQVNLNVGIAYTKLLSFSAKDIYQMDVSNQIIYKKKDFYHLQTGLTYFFTKKVGLNMKATVPIQVEDWTIATRLIFMIK